MEKYILKNKLLKLAAFNNSIGEVYGGRENIDFSGAIPSSFWYLHGNLVDIVGYDKAVMLNAGKLGMLSESNESCIVGIISVFIYNIIEPCIGYFWEDTRYYSSIHSNIQRGYVCLLSDREGRKWAFFEMMKRLELENLKAN